MITSVCSQSKCNNHQFGPSQDGEPMISPQHSDAFAGLCAVQREDEASRQQGSRPAATLKQSLKASPLQLCTFVVLC